MGSDQGSARVSNEPAPLGYVAALDGLRGLALAGVLFFHQDRDWLPGGYFSVSAFFTLSGYLITRLLLVEHERTGTLDLKAFWGRRVRRLWPALLLCTLAIVLMATIGNQAVATQLQQLRFDALAALTSTANWRMLAGGRGYGGLLAAPSPFQHFWSLAIEEQFYLLFPPLLLLLMGWSGTTHPRRERARRRRAAQVLTALVVASIAIGILSRSAGSARVYYGTDTRAGEILIGCLLAFVMHNRPYVQRQRNRLLLAVASLASIGALAWMWATIPDNSPLLYYGIFPLHALLICVVIVAAIQPRSPVQAGLGVNPLRALGCVSYGAYLFHWPIFLWLTPSVVHLTGFALFLARVVVTLSLALISYQLLEVPVRQRTIGRSRTFAFVMPSLSVLILLIAVVVTRNPPKGSTAEVALQVKPAKVETQGVVGPAPSPLGHPVNVVFAGDSLGYQVGFGSSAWLKAWPGRIQPVGLTAVAGCGVVSDGELPARDQEIRLDIPQCRNVAQRNQAVVDTRQPDVFVVTTGPWDAATRQLPGEEEWRVPGDPALDDFILQQWQLVVDAMTSKGAVVVWVKWPCVEPRNLLPDGGPLPSGFDAARLATLYANVLPRLEANNQGRLKVVDLSESLCPGGVFQQTAPDGVPLRDPDGMHMGPEGLTRAIDQIFPVVLDEAKQSHTAAPPVVTPAAQPVAGG